MKRFFLRLFGFRDYVIIGITKSNRPFFVSVFTNSIEDAINEAEEFHSQNDGGLSVITSVNRL